MKQIRNSFITYFLDDGKRRNEEETNYVNLCLKLVWTTDTYNNVYIMSWYNYIPQHFRNMIMLMTFCFNTHFQCKIDQKIITDKFQILLKRLTKIDFIVINKLIKFGQIFKPFNFEGGHSHKQNY